MARTAEAGKRYTISIRKADSVRVLAGNPRKNTVVVEHANIIKRHTRPNPQKNIKGGIVEREAAMNVSKVQVICGSCGKHTRVGHSTLADGTRVRACKRCGTTLDK